MGRNMCDCFRSASTRVVLPWSTWAMIATLRRSSRRVGTDGVGEVGVKVVIQFHFDVLRQVRAEGGPEIVTSAGGLTPESGGHGGMPAQAPCPSRRSNRFLIRGSHNGFVCIGYGNFLSGSTIFPSPRSAGTAPLVSRCSSSLHCRHLFAGSDGPGTGRRFDCLSWWLSWQSAWPSRYWWTRDTEPMLLRHPR